MAPGTCVFGTSLLKKANQFPLESVPSMFEVVFRGHLKVNLYFLSCQYGPYAPQIISLTLTTEVLEPALLFGIGNIIGVPVSIRKLGKKTKEKFKIAEMADGHITLERL